MLAATLGFDVRVSGRSCCMQGVSKTILIPEQLTLRTNYTQRIVSYFLMSKGTLVQLTRTNNLVYPNENFSSYKTNSEYFSCTLTILEL